MTASFPEGDFHENEVHIMTLRAVWLREFRLSTYMLKVGRYELGGQNSVKRPDNAIYRRFLRLFSSLDRFRSVTRDLKITVDWKRCRVFVSPHEEFYTLKISVHTLNTSVIGMPAYRSSAPLSSQILDMNEEGLRIKPSSYKIQPHQVWRKVKM